MFNNTVSNIARYYLIYVLALTSKRFTVGNSGTLEPRIPKAFS